jgi:hypothetical protein
VEEVTRVGKVPGGARVGLLPFLGTGVCGCGGWFGGGGEASGLCGGVPRGRAVALRESGVVLRERESRGV